MSFGGRGDSEIIHEAIQDAYAAGIVLVGAAGNDATQIPGYPGAYEEVIGVIASYKFPTFQFDREYIGRAYFSTFGYWADIAAPGFWIYSTIPNNEYEWMSGTSMATPLVAGVAGLIKSVDQDRTNAQVRNILYKSAANMELHRRDSPLSGEGLVNIHKALTFGGDPDYYATARISNPLYFDIRNKHDPIPIEGIIDTSFGIDIVGLRIAYGLSPGEDDFSEEHIELNQNIQEGTEIQQLGILDASEFEQTGPYTLSLKIVDQEGNRKWYQSIVYIDVNLRSGFPVELPVGWTDLGALSVIATPTVSDLNNDRRDEIIVAKPINYEEGIIYVFDEEGAVLDGWPYQTEFIIQNGMAVGDVNDQFPGKEIIAVLGNRITILSNAGDVLAQHNVHENNDEMRFHGSVQIMDVDNDGNHEIFNANTEWDNGDPQCDLLSFTLENIENPVVMDPVEGMLEEGGNQVFLLGVDEFDIGVDFIGGRQVLFTIDDEPLPLLHVGERNEIGNGFSIRVLWIELGGEGNSVRFELVPDTMNVVFNWAQEFESFGMPCDLYGKTFADLDADGVYEIVVHYAQDGERENLIHIFDEEGNLIYSDGDRPDEEDWSFTSHNPVAADINDDGRDELILARGDTHGIIIYEYDDALNELRVLPEWMPPQSIIEPMSYYNTLLANMDDDDAPEIFFGTFFGDWGNSIARYHLYNADRTELPAWPFISYGQEFQTHESGAVADVNLDGMKDFLLATQQWRQSYICGGIDYCFFATVLDENGVLILDLLQTDFFPNHMGPIVGDLDGNMIMDIVSYSRTYDIEKLFAWEIPSQGMANIDDAIEWQQLGNDEARTFRYDRLENPRRDPGNVGGAAIEQGAALALVTQQSLFSRLASWLKSLFS